MSTQRPGPPRMTRRRRRRRPSAIGFLWRLILAAVKLGLLAALLLLAGGAFLYYRYGSDLPDPQQISEHRSFETTRIYARDGETLLFELIGPQAGRRIPVSFERIPLSLRQATIAVEDAGFYENPGVDLRGIVRAAWQNYQSGEIVSGASTITMQLVRNILLPPEEASERSYERKLREAILAFRVSREYSKDQILSIYLNEVYYGAQAYGVEAAAQTYFGKHVWELSVAEATLLAGLPQSPSQIDPYTNFLGAKARQRVTLDLMAEAGYLSADEAERVFNEPLILRPQRSDLLAPHFVFYVRDLLERRYGPDLLYRAGLRVVTTLDLNWQAQAQQVVQEQVAGLRARGASNAGVVMLSPDGQILAMVGSVDYNGPDGQVNVTTAPRQPGSALKPFVYAAALERGWTPATVIWDVPTEWRTAGGAIYRPQNYDNAFHGPMRLRMALANSLNIPAVKALEFVGVERFVELMSQLGVSTFTDPDRFGLAMALGSNEVRLLELGAAYNALANAGRATPPVAVLRVTNSRGELIERWQPTPGRQIFGPQSEQIAYLTTHILSDAPARWFMFGRGNVMELPGGIVAAAKTGTSNDFRDSWALGYTSQVTIGVWVGNNDSTPMQEVAGSNGAGLIWRELMIRYHQAGPPPPLPRPAGIVEQLICADTGGRAGEACPRPVGEIFLAGTAPTEIDVTYQTVRVGGDGSCLATSYTPPDQVREVTFAVYPAGFRDWASRNLPQPPSQPCPQPQAADQLVAALDELDAAALRDDQVFVSGTARGPFTLEFGAGPVPSTWQLVGQNTQAVEQGLLGVWFTGGLEPGEYTLRLRVATPDGLSIEATRLVRIGN